MIVVTMRLANCVVRFVLIVVSLLSLLSLLSTSSLWWSKLGILFWELSYRGGGVPVAGDAAAQEAIVKHNKVLVVANEGN